MSLTTEIKEYALDIGYSKVGITSADDFDDHIEEVTSRAAIYDFYKSDLRQFLNGATPKQMMPAAKSIICLVWDYAQRSFPESLIGKIGRIYQARCYAPPPQRLNGARRKLMLDFLENKGIRTAPTIFIPERRAAARAGVATFGKNNFAFAKGIGSFIVLSSIVVDAELDYDSPTLDVRCPKGCDACIKACPTGAIYEPLKLDPRRCIAFNAWWTQDGKPPNITSDIPMDIRKRMGTRVHGCDVCQEACPRNQARLKAKLPPDPFLDMLAQNFSLERMLRMSDDFYTHRVMPIMYNYIKEKKYFQRNAAIALGNTKDPAYIPDLAKAMRDPEDLVRAYSAWALGRIGGSKAKEELSANLKTENSIAVQKEIKQAIEMAE